MIIDILEEEGKREGEREGGVATVAALMPALKQLGQQVTGAAHAVKGGVSGIVKDQLQPLPQRVAAEVVKQLHERETQQVCLASAQESRGVHAVDVCTTHEEVAEVAGFQFLDTDPEGGANSMCCVVCLQHGNILHIPDWNRHMRGHNTARFGHINLGRPVAGVKHAVRKHHASAAHKLCLST